MYIGSIVLKTGAVFSDCRCYRYSLWRIWDFSGPLVMFIGLNPSTADERHDDPTLVRCLRFAKEWGFSGLYMANLFAYRATNPRALTKVIDPIGVENDKWLIDLSQRSETVVGAWGNRGRYLNRSSLVSALIPDMKCIKRNKSGEPAHPLYQKSTASVIPLYSSERVARVTNDKCPSIAIEQADHST